MTIEINTNMPPKEKKPEESKEKTEEKQEGRQRYEFTMPASLLE